MTSFNTINGVPATGNKWLMRHILREEMGFDGVLISDWAAIEEIIYHGYCEDRKEAAVRAAEAGVDIDIVEDGDTFAANALIKAKAVWEKTGGI